MKLAVTIDITHDDLDTFGTWLGKQPASFREALERLVVTVTSPPPERSPRPRKARGPARAGREDRRRGTAN